MGFMLAQVRLIRETRLPEDDVVNTFHFLTPTAGVTAADVDNVRDRLRTFYNGPSNWQNFLSPNLLGGLDAHRIRFYDIAGPAPHPPLREERSRSRCERCPASPPRWPSACPTAPHPPQACQLVAAEVASTSDRSTWTPSRRSSATPGRTRLLKRRCSTQGQR